MTSMSSYDFISTSVAKKARSQEPKNANSNNNFAFFASLKGKKQRGLALITIVENAGNFFGINATTAVL